MFNQLAGYRFSFEQPWWLLLLALIPLYWFWSYRSLAGLGGGRRIAALTLRSLVTALIVLAIAGIQWVQISDRITVVYLLDQSLSIPEPERREMARFVNAQVRAHWQDGDKVGVIVFGRDAAMEVQPFADRIRVPENVESQIDPTATNLEAAMKMAQAAFLPGSARRIVVVSDFDQNSGNAIELARLLSEKGIGIDVRPVRFENENEIIVEKLARPADIRKGQPFDLRAVVTNTGDRDVSGRLEFLQKTDDEPVVLNADPQQQRIVLKPGKNVFTLRREIDEPNYYEYEVRFIPESVRDDSMPQNNQASTFVHVRGSGQVLLIEGQETPGEHAFLAERLRQNNLEVRVRPSASAFASLGELQQFDVVILADVPRDEFSDEQIEMLVANTQHAGAGLVMLGGPNSFGAGGWTNSQLEKAMPVDFQVPNAKAVPKGALALIMHASELPDGNHWQKVIAQEAIKTLGSQDYCGLAHWNGTEQWLWNNPRGMVPVGQNRNMMLARLDRMVPGDMPDFDPTLRMALRGLTGLPDAAVKHVVVISDGDPSPPSASLVNQFVSNKITVSSVAVGTHGPAGSNIMRDLASQTGGKYYEVRNNRTLPRIFQREARRVARPLIYDNPPPFSPTRHYPHEMLEGLPEEFPPMSGFVMTSAKQNTLVEVSLLSPRPGDREYPVLASWTYGLGRSVCFTSDAGARWCNAWADWEGYDKFFGQMIRWAMRPSEDDNRFLVATDIEDNQARVVITALDEDDQFINLMQMTGRVVGPDGKPEAFEVRQVAPGRYVGVFRADEAGSHLVAIGTEPGKPPLRVGVNVPYSPEFRQRITDEHLAREMAALSPPEGRPGELIEIERVDPAEARDWPNPFRRDLPKATLSQDAWFWLVAAACGVFLGDVFVRRVQISLTFLRPAWEAVRRRVLRREAPPQRPDYLQRLRSRKDEVGEQIEQRRAAQRFEAEPGAGGGAVAEELRGGTSRPAEKRPDAAAGMAPQQEADTYTSRLLKAKKQARAPGRSDPPGTNPPRPDFPPPEPGPRDSS